MEFKHYSVLLEETIEHLNIKPDGTYADGTLGGGGHASEVVKRLSDKGRFLKVYYMTQVGIRPPHFVAFCNDKQLFHFSYRRYLENQIRGVFGLEGTPVIMTVRQKGEEDM